jgi:putative addiction module component (TIGR02574 family)
MSWRPPGGSDSSRPTPTLLCTGSLGQIRDMTKQALLSEILRLPLEERIELLGEAWDAIAAAPGDVPLPEWHLEELEHRLSDPNPRFVSWKEVRSRLRNTTES